MVVFRGENAAYEFIETIFKEYQYCFNRVPCWICGESIVDEKVRDHCYVTSKFRDAAHRSCSISQFKRL